MLEVRGVAVVGEVGDIIFVGILVCCLVVGFVSGINRVIVIG